MSGLKTIALSLVLFLAQVFLVGAYADQVHEAAIPMLRKYLAEYLQLGQRFALDSAGNALASNEHPGTKIYWVGGSTAHNYFGILPGDYYDGQGSYRVYNLAFPTESMYDTLRLVDNIEGPGVLVMAIHPGKMWSQSEQQVTLGYNKTGQLYLLLLPSRAADAYYASKDWGEDRRPFRKLFALNPELGIIKQTLDAYTTQLDKRLKRLKRVKRETVGERLLAVPRPERYVGLAGFTYRQRVDFYAKLRSKWCQSEDDLERNLDIFGRIYELAKDKGLKIIIFEHPVSQTYREQLPGCVDGMVRVREEIKARYPMVEFQTFNIRGFEGDEYLFLDGMHLSPLGKEILRPELKKFFSRIASE